VLLISEGTVTVQGSGGQRTIAAGELFKDYLLTAIEPGEVLTEVHVPSLDGWGSGYQKFNRRSEDWAMVGVSAVVKQTGDICEDVRVGLTNMGHTPSGPAPSRTRSGVSRSTPRASRGPPRTPPTERLPRPISTRAPTTSPTSRRC
jgi:xanthine dehydrogenase iron-sulfur cluster and FAD-binding subunit A